MPLQETSGNVTSDAFGGGVAAEVNYIESVFSTYLYTGNGTSQTITNGIDLSTKGGLVWQKARNDTTNNGLSDTAQGPSQMLFSNLTNASSNYAYLTSFNTNGYSIGNAAINNFNGDTYVSWTFRKQPKFFDVVTYTGTGSNTTIAHNLGSVPGCIIVKRTDTTSNWQVYHNGLTSAAYSIQLNSTAAQASATTVWNSTAPTSTVFSVGTDATVNASGGTYVAYIYAHNAGGFGLTGTDNVISCGSFTDSSGSINLGYEPQWILYKNSNNAGDWTIVDVMRGDSVYSSGANTKQLYPNTSGAETGGYGPYPTATGFNIVGLASGTYIYIAIRRGPMKVPTDATKVFAPIAYTGNGNTGLTVSSLTSPVDLAILSARNAQNPKMLFSDRLRGSGTGENSGNMKTLTSTSTVAESDSSLNGYYATLDYQNSVRLLGSSSGIYNGGSVGYVLYSMQRAPSFFDEVCYIGTSTAGHTENHNLGVSPELIITKCRNTTSNWTVVSSSLNSFANYMNLNQQTASLSSPSAYTVTSTTFTMFNGSQNNTSGNTYVAYLFSTCLGVSKVGSYTGNGTTQTINCGFTGGARFVLIKRTDATSDWYVYDTARGMTTLTDPYLLLNSTAAEVATLGSVTTVTTGFALNEAIFTGINTNAATYIFLAIA